MPIAFTPDFKMVQTWFPFCYLSVAWWDGEYEGNCCLREDHPSQHTGGDLQNKRECADRAHERRDAKGLGRLR